MTHWHLSALIVGFGTLACFVGAMRFYFRPASVRIPQVIIVIAAFVVASMSHSVALVAAKHVAQGWRIAGLTMFAISHIVFWSSVWAHGSRRPGVAFTTDLPEALVRRGPYRWVRHPFYLAYVIAWCAGSVVTATPWLAIAALAMFLVYRAAAK